jgi:hypothetical protein
MYFVGRAFLDAEPCMNCTAQSGTYWFRYSPLSQSHWDKAHAGNLKRLELDRCVNEYATNIQSNRRNLLPVSNDSGVPPPTENEFINGSHIYWAFRFHAHDASSPEKASFAFNWICSASHEKHTPCSVGVGNVRKQDSWQVRWWPRDDQSLCELSRSPVEYCLSEPAQPHCKLHFELTITTIIMLLNLCKFKFRSLYLKRRSSTRHVSIH